MSDPHGGPGGGARPYEAPDYGLFDRSGISAMIAQPRPDPSTPPPGASDHRIEVAAGRSLAARFYELGPRHPTVLLFHGNGEVVGDHDHGFHLYHAAGLNLFVAEYRGYGRSDGAFSMADLVADAHPVAAYLHALLDRRGFPGGRFVMGRSLGAAPALEIAARAPARFRGVVIESGGSGMRRLLDHFGYPENAEGWRLVERHEAKIRAIALPTMQIHGALDDRETATELYDLLAGAPTRALHLIDGAGHNDLLLHGHERYMALLRQFVDSHLDGGGDAHLDRRLDLAR